jgi:type IV pilus assembly protein PilV
MATHIQHPGKQKGVMLLEALIAILIFSIGILALVGLQATSISMSSDAKYRSTASMLANQMIGRMWNDIAVVTASGPATTYSITEFDNYIGDPGNNTAPTYATWLATVQNNLPNATATVTRSTVVTPSPAVPNSIQTSVTSVSVSVCWRLPSAVTPSPLPVTCPNTSDHSYTTSAQVSAQKNT